MPATPPPSAIQASRAIGAMFMSFFGTMWLAGADAIARHGGDWLLVPIAVAGAAVFVTAWRRWHTHRAAKAEFDATPRARHIARVFNIVNAGQWIVIVVLANVLRNVGLDDWVLAMVMAVVGLHFLPLAKVMRYPAHYVSGIALLLIAAAYPFLAVGGPQSAVGPVGAGVVLWGSAVYALISAAGVGKRVQVA